MIGNNLKELKETTFKNIESYSIPRVDNNINNSTAKVNILLNPLTNIISPYMLDGNIDGLVTPTTNITGLINAPVDGPILINERIKAVAKQQIKNYTSMISDKILTTNGGLDAVNDAQTRYNNGDTSGIISEISSSINDAIPFMGNNKTENIKDNIIYRNLYTKVYGISPDKDTNFVVRSEQIYNTLRKIDVSNTISETLKTNTTDYTNKLDLNNNNNNNNNNTEKLDSPLTRRDIPNNQIDSPLTRRDIPNNQLENTLTRRDIPNNQIDSPLTRRDIPNNQLENTPIRRDIPNNQIDSPLTRRDIPNNQLENTPIRRDIPNNQL
ncbi:MAG: hypothetical protein NTZ20_05735, partial [Candidatus Levybacteria bacterium]|nr:hypothetical protein [Candidatus Levybacteria bacterium]